MIIIYLSDLHHFNRVPTFSHFKEVLLPLFHLKSSIPKLKDCIGSISPGAPSRSARKDWHIGSGCICNTSMSHLSA